MKRIIDMLYDAIVMQQQAKGRESNLLEFLQSAQKPLVVILGPTASGKTRFTFEVARELSALDRQSEIVNADSRQLYRFLDIGTAKSTEAEWQGIPHHLLDVLDPSEGVTAAWYQEKALRAIDAILERGSVPMLVGGSMLYLSSVIDGLSFAPEADAEVRRRLEELYDRDGGIALHRRLSELDPESALSIHPHNKPYIIRALEIVERTGTPASLQKHHSSCSYDLFIMGMELPRDELHRRINARTKQMFERGWIEEVEDLLARGFRPEHPGMLSHGYREIIAFLEGDIDDLQKLQELIAAKTRQYAKRQFTWWRGDPRIRWAAPTAAA